MKTQPSLAELLFPNQYRRKVLALLLMQPDQKVHLRELARQTQAAPGTLKKELDALCAVGLLRSERVGNQVHFQANPAHPVFAELQALVRKTTGLADVLRQALQPLGEQVALALVFGSMASGSAHAGSDVDLLVVGHRPGRRAAPGPAWPRDQPQGHDHRRMGRQTKRGQPPNPADRNPECLKKN